LHCLFFYRVGWTNCRTSNVNSASSTMIRCILQIKTYFSITRYIQFTLVTLRAKCIPDFVECISEFLLRGSLVVEVALSLLPVPWPRWPSRVIGLSIFVCQMFIRMCVWVCVFYFNINDNGKNNMYVLCKSTVFWKWLFLTETCQPKTN